MEQALAEARLAGQQGEIPVGAVVVVNERRIASGRNRRERCQDPTAHAELIAVQHAAARLGTWRLSDATVYVTLEPCPMCAGMLVQARIARLVYGCRDPKAGAVHSLFTITDDPRLNHRIPCTEGVLETACAGELSRFFRAIRRR